MADRLDREQYARELRQLADRVEREIDPTPVQPVGRRRGLARWQKWLLWGMAIYAFAGYMAYVSKPYNDPEYARKEAERAQLLLIKQELWKSCHWGKQYHSYCDDPEMKSPIMPRE